MKKRASRTSPRRRRTAAEWERDWKEQTSRSPSKAYELPAGGDGERAFLGETRTPEKEKERLLRIQAEFVRGFKEMYHVGPAVTVFGSARFKENHRYYSSRGRPAASSRGPASPR
jgi:hypothetical protein